MTPSDTPVRPTVAEVIGEDDSSMKETPTIDEHTPIEERVNSAGSQELQFNLDVVKSCIKRISILDKTQNDRAM